MRRFSCVNRNCLPFLNLLTAAELERLQLPDVTDDVQWALMTVRTSPSSEWSIYMRYLATSAFYENLLCKQHAVIRGAVICVRDAPPTIRLSERVFALHSRATDPDQPTDHPLYLTLPLEPSESSIPVLGTTTFLPLAHGLHFLGMSRSIGERIVHLAGLTPPEMKRFLTFYRDAAAEIQPWLLWDLTRVAHPAHLAVRMPPAFQDDISSGNDSEEPLPLPHDDMFVSTLHRGALLPMIWASMPGWGMAPVPGSTPGHWQNPADGHMGDIHTVPGVGWSTS